MSENFPGFPFPAGSIEKYFHNLNFFMLKMEDGELISFTAEDEKAFSQWLKKNHIPDIRDMEE